MSEDVSEVVSQLREMNNWLRVLALPTLRERLFDEISAADEWRVYQATNGSSMREVGGKAEVPHSRVQRLWARWAAAGIVAPADESGRFVRLVDLDSLGIPEPSN